MYNLITLKYQPIRFELYPSNVVVSGVCTALKTKLSCLSIEIRLITNISSPRFIWVAQPDKKESIQGVIFPDFGKKLGSMAIVFLYLISSAWFANAKLNLNQSNVFLNAFL